MDTFSFLSVLFSVIMGLALTEVLQGFRGLMLARKRVTIYWPALLWGGLVILIVAQAWWGMFSMHNLVQWNFLMYGTVIVQITLLYLASGVAMPDVPDEGPVDMRATYYANHRWFFTLMALTVATTFVKDYIFGGRIEAMPNLLMLIYYLLLCIAAAVTSRPWFHWALAPLTALGVVTNAALLSFRL